MSGFFLDFGDIEVVVGGTDSFAARDFFPFVSDAFIGVFFMSRFKIGRFAG